MAEVASAFVSLLPSARGFGSKMESELGGEVKGAGKRLGSGFGKMFAVAGGLLAAAGIGSFLKDSIGEAREAQKVGALTESIIKSTGGAAKVTAEQVGDLASAISLKTGMDDEAIQSGANLLLTFKNVRNELGKGNKIFDRATQAATDLSAAGFGDMAGQSKMLGKALNDPIKGITALSRSGVTFSEGQKEQIKTLVESGKTLQAQKIILGEVESQVGGAAAATATYGEKASVAFGNIKEQVGTELLVPGVDALSKAFLGLVPSITRGISAIKPAFAQAQAFLAPFIAQVQDFFNGSGKSAVAGFATTLGEVFKQNVLPVLQTAANTFQTVVLPAVTSLVTYVGTSLLPVLSQVATIVISRVLPIVSSLAQFFYGTLYPAVVGVATAVARNLKPVFDQLVVTFQSKVLPTVDLLLANFQRYQPTIQRVIGVVVKVIGKVLEFAAAILGKVLPVAIRFQAFLISGLVRAMVKVVGGIASAVGAVIDFGRKIVGAVQKVAQFQRGVAEKVGKVVDLFTKLPGKITGAIGNAGTMLLDVGKNIMSGLISGIRSMASGLVTAIKNSVTDKIPGFVKKAMGIKSPSRVMMRLGAFMMDGLILPFRKGEGRLEGAMKKLLGRGASKALIQAFTSNGMKGLVIDWAKVVGVKGKGAEKALDTMRDRLEKGLEKLRKAAEKKVDGLKSTLDGMRSFASSVASSFRVDLFSGSLGDLFKNGLAGNANLRAVIDGFQKLIRGGWSKAFLSSLIQSGNSGLILQLANADSATVAQAQSVFATQNALSNQLGAVAAEFNSGQTFKGVEDRLDKANKKLDALPDKIGKSVGKSLNSAASQGKRGRRRDAA